MDRLLAQFTNMADAGMVPAIQAMMPTLLALSVIAIAIAGLTWALGEERGFVVMLRTCFVVAFTSYALMNWDALTTLVVRSVFHLAVLITGRGSVDDLLSPDTVFFAGARFTVDMIRNAEAMSGVVAFFDNIGAIFFMLIAGFFITITFAVIATMLGVALLGIKLVILAGILLLPFQAFNKTSFLADNVYGHVMSAALRVFTFMIIIGGGHDFFSTMPPFPGRPRLEEILSLFGVVALYGGAATILPFVVGSMATSLARVHQ